LFLRSGEASGETVDPTTGSTNPTGLTIESFDLSLSIVNGNLIESLVVKVMGKTDSRPVNLTLWADHDNPEFCPVLHLQVYLYIARLKDGHLFPPIEEILAGKEVHTSWLSYQIYQSRFVQICRQLFPRQSKWGTHTMRKTAYLFAVWGGGEFEIVRRSARHEDSKTAKQYEQDANYLLTASKSTGSDVASIVSKWKPVMIENAQMARSFIDASLQKPLFDLCSSFLEDSCQVRRNSPNFGVKYCLQKAFAYKNSTTTIDKVIFFLRSS